MEKKRKPAATEAQAARRKNAIQGAAASTAAQLFSAAVLLWLRAGSSGIFSRLALLIALLDLVIILPLWAALWLRLREIEKGEEEDASQY